MGIAEEILLNHFTPFIEDKDSIIEAMKEYALYVAQDALNRAADNASFKDVQEYIHSSIGYQWIKEIDTDSIICTEIILE